MPLSFHRDFTLLACCFLRSICLPTCFSVCCVYLYALLVCFFVCFLYVGVSIITICPLVCMLVCLYLSMSVCLYVCTYVYQICMSMTMSVYVSVSRYFVCGWIPERAVTKCRKIRPFLLIPPYRCPNMRTPMKVPVVPTPFCEEICKPLPGMGTSPWYPVIHIYIYIYIYMQVSKQISNTRIGGRGLNQGAHPEVRIALPDCQTTSLAAALRLG